MPFSSAALRQFDSNSGANHGCGRCPDCVSCQHGAFALRVDNALQDVAPPDLISPLTHGIAVFRCPINGTCMGGNRTTTCAAGYHGGLCGACADGYGRQRDKTCVKCNGVTTIRQNRIIYLATLLAVLLMAVTWFAREHVDKLYRLVLKGEMIEHGKIVISFFQVTHNQPTPDPFICVHLLCSNDYF